ncbi:LacI family DNA-binding transcriptional regulator [Nocardioides bruguierae]|uniref:LacI family transcriptional regulator n=1 Tax=Nocardioides bruguierae TaxID=2945102 RepID=A0A9X2IF08_9ACTN|nr:LacI family DNA-binding transcriptional regulator [Nocardioides bruguierae]MCM0620857.1 LacI family transcriptional regulator [Nocardioides bruguierae]
MSENRSGAVGKPPTMADVARHLGISRQLVSIVMRDAPGASEETRARVREAARELGFAPHTGARTLRQTRSWTLGVLFVPAHAAEHEIVEAIYPLAAKHGYDVVLSALTDTRGLEASVEELVGHRCAALLLIGAPLEEGLMARLVDRVLVPVVSVGSGARNGDYDVIRSAGDEGMRAAVEHLVSLGHEEIAFVTLDSMPDGPLRRRGYESAVRDLGREVDLVTVPGDYRDDDYFEEAGAAAGLALLERPRLPTAVLVPNDSAAIGLLLTLARNGVRVPQDVSLVGFDDNPMSRLSAIDLTTSRQDPEMLARAAVDVAVRRIEAEPGTVRRTGELVVPTTFIARSSSAEPRRG